MAVVLTAVYTGYFGAEAGITMLAVMSLQDREPLPGHQRGEERDDGHRQPRGRAGLPRRRAGGPPRRGRPRVRRLLERPLRWAIGVAVLCPDWHTSGHPPSLRRKA